MNEAVKKLLETAESQVGYKEAYNNITKYSEDFDKNWVDFYNTKKQGAAWCDIFVDWCFVTTFGYNDALKLLCQPEHSLGAGCTYSARYYRDHNQFVHEPEPGDQIFFGDIDDLDHTGIVWKVTPSYVHTIEGNANNMVQKKKYQLSDSNIAGYGRPNWNIVGEDVAPEPAVEPSEPDMGGYTINNTYTVLVSALNVRTGPGKAYELVGYDNLTQDGKRHASMFGALLRGTRVTCLDVKKEGDNVWMEIPSGWICARWGDNVYVG